MTSHLFSMMGTMLMTQGRVHNDVDTRRRPRAWRDVTSKSSMEGRSRSNFMNIELYFEEQMGPPALMTSMTFKWTSITDAKCRHFKRQPNYCLIYIYVCLKQKEKEWLIDYLYSILWYFILITLIWFFNFPVKKYRVFLEGLCFLPINC